MPTQIDGIRINNHVLNLSLKSIAEIGGKIKSRLREIKDDEETVNYEVKSGQTYAIFRLTRRSPHVYTIFKNGHVNVTGVRRLCEIEILVHKLLEKLRLLPHVEEVKNSARVANISATAIIKLNKGEYVDLKQLYKNARRLEYESILAHARYDSKRFPACNLKIHRRGSLLVFSSGKVVIVGCKSDVDIRYLVHDFLPLLLLRLAIKRESLL